MSPFADISANGKQLERYLRSYAAIQYRNILLFGELLLSCIVIMISAYVCADSFRSRLEQVACRLSIDISVERPAHSCREARYQRR